MLLSATAVAHKPLFYCLTLQPFTHLHLPHSNPLPLDLILPSPCQPNTKCPSRHLSPVVGIHSSLLPVARRAFSNDQHLVPSSAAVVAAAVRRASPSSPVKFTQRVEKQVYVRPAGSYVMDQLDLCRVAMHPETDISVAIDRMMLVGIFYTN